MEQLTVALPERAYDIVIERGLLQQVGQQCKEVLKPGCRVAELGVRLGMTPGELPLLLKTVVRNFGLPDRIPCTTEDYQSAIGLDKKGSGSKISVILLTELGQAQAVPMEKAQLFQLIDEIEKESL